MRAAGAIPARQHAGPTTSRAQVGSAKTQDGEEGFVDAPLLFRADVADEFAKSACVDGPDLFDEHSSWLSEQFDLRAERGSPCAGGCRSDKYH